jgi:adenosylmethionine-8-amino-7-oxononanoate aminotransferase
MDVNELLALDAAHVWHPYASMPGQHASLPIRSAAGVRLRLHEPIGDVAELIDGMSSWWAAIHGYANPLLDKAIRDQLDQMSHVMFGGLTHEPAVKLATKLVEITPEPLRHVFLSDSGSVSVEVAIKMALQYWRGKGNQEKRRLMTWRGGYHGDTFHPMSVCDPEGGMHQLWQGILPQQLFASTPPAGFAAGVDPDYVSAFETLLAEKAGEVAAIIVEPVVQGAGGMTFHDPGYLRILRELADKYGVLLIFDEIATGFGRTGKLFAADHADVSPDIMCLGKALTGGYLSLAATLCTPEVAQGIAQGDVPVLAHGPTFMGNPLACAVALASVDLLLGSDWQSKVNLIERTLFDELATLKLQPGVRDVRVLGGIAVVQLDRQVDIAAATAAAVAHGVWLRPFRDLVYAMPPYIVEEPDLRQISVAIAAAAHAG